ncbi:helix-turn-helix domain-containing protein [Devosia sp. YIM 151766]|uniref:helix-turn-helix transcriptional regulator n=1 Tax=Devosia sp. YIM 151766 TaxID=3017325 RepID=UPI00255C728D|nr:helix-turn-helix domain-containing protein [Devosia sp. YIM 151766]WIY52443.1 helix-turn-helix domain-containing protein [Devosia sp. YIM 151766]
MTEATAPTETMLASGLLDDWMSRKELAEELSLSVDTLSRWETQRIGPPCIRIGRRVLYRRGAVQDWLRRAEERTSSRTRARS